MVFSDLNKDACIQPFSEDCGAVPNFPDGSFAYSEILQENNYYPFGMQMEGPWQVVISAPENGYLYNGKELNTDFDLNWLDYGARWYDPAIGRWNAVDPLAEQYAPYSPYNYTLNNPIRFIDPDGMRVDDLIVKGGKVDGAKAIQSFKNEVFINTGGLYQANIDSKGNVTLSKTGLEKMNVTIQMTAKQAAFKQELESVINSPVKTEVELVSSDALVAVGDITDNKIDMADIAAFDKAGPGVSSSAGALSHELAEQHEKAKAGGTKGVYPSGAYGMHKKGIEAENRVNGSERRDNLTTGQQYFINKDGSVYEQQVTNTKSGTVKVTKTKIK